AGQGYVTTNIQGDDFAAAMALEGGRVVIVGTSGTGVGAGVNSDMAVVRYSDGGVLDGGFGTGGVFRFDKYNDNTATAVTLDGAGHILVGGSLGPSDPANQQQLFAMLRLK